jgi:hypothetical protein
LVTIKKVLKQLISIINILLNHFNYRIAKIDIKYEKKLNLYKEIIVANSRKENNSMGTIIFSMDRAIQLDALLRSFFMNKIGDCKVTVIYKASNKEHKNAYFEVIESFQESVKFIEEGEMPFKILVIDTIEDLNTDKIFFLVDDIIFTHEVDFNKLIDIDTSKYIFSLRMGEHLNYSYVVNKIQELPKLIKNNEDYIYWDWNESQLDWAYPLSVDGHIFNRNEIKALIKFCDFKAPNTLEGALQTEKELFGNKLGISYKQARIFNNPCNKVQSEVANLHGSLHQDDLLKVWQNGKQIDVKILQGLINKSVHEEIDFIFEDRT